MILVNGSLLCSNQVLWERLSKPESSSSEMLIQEVDKKRPSVRGGRRKGKILERKGVLEELEEQWRADKCPVG